jgi:hypothetical protein
VVRALRGLLELATDASSRFALHLGLALLSDLGGDANAKVALGHYREALALCPTSPSAAAGAARLGEARGDIEAKIASSRALADLTKDGAERAGYLVHAAGLLLSAPDGPLGTKGARRARASEILERALDASPGSAPAASLLTTILKEDKQRDRLIAVLRKALARASEPDAIVTIGRALARAAREEPTDWPLVVDALSRVREAAPADVATLAGLAEAYTAQRALPEAASILETIAGSAVDASARKTALSQLADLYDRLPGREADTLRVLRAARELDPRDARAAKALLDHLRERGADAKAEIAALLDALMSLEEEGRPRASLAVELARARVELGDRAAAERALAEAIAETPTDAMLGAAKAFAPSPRDEARLLAAAGTRANEIGRPAARIWFALASLEIDALAQLPEGVAHARTALALDPQAHDGRALLARGLARGGKHAEAAAAVLAMIEPDPTPLVSLADARAPLAILEESLSAGGRPHEALVARELRALAGGLDDAAASALRARRLPPWYDDDGPPALDGATLRDRVFPAEARHVLLDVAAAVAGTEARLFPDELAVLGLTPRDRIGQDDPLWPAFERARRALGVTEVELAVCEGVPHPRVVTRAPPWIVVPPALASQPAPVQVAALSRALARIALGMTWIDRLSPTHVRGLLLAAARLVAPSYGDDLRDGDQGAAANDYARPLGRAITRAQKKALAALAPTLEAGPTVAEIEALMRGAKRTEVRVAFLMTGDMLATVDELRLPERTLRAVFAHPLAGDAFRFALTQRATALRREVGTLFR